MTCEKRPVNHKFHSTLENIWHYQKMLNMDIPHDYRFHSQIIPKHSHRRCMHDHLWQSSLPSMADSLPIFKKYLPQSFSDFKAKYVWIWRVIYVKRVLHVHELVKKKNYILLLDF